MRTIVAGIAFAALWGGVASGAAEDIVINEVMYNPGAGPVTDPENDALEFIELYNRGAAAVDISGWSFSNGVDYTFPEGTILAVDEYLVVAKDPARIEAQFGITNVLGPYGLVLKNGGERLELTRPPVAPETLPVVVETMSFDDEPPWPTRADGTGASMERINPQFSNDAPGNWDASVSGLWQHVSIAGTATSSRLYIYLNGAGVALLDDVEIRPEGGGDNQIVNGSFENATLDPWTASGTHASSVLYAADRHAGAQCLRLVASGAGDGSGNGVSCYASPTLVQNDRYVVTAWVKFVSGAQGLVFRLSGSGINGTVTPASALATPGARNSVYSTDGPPSIENPRMHLTPPDPLARKAVFHEPRMPTSSQAVGFKVRVRDDHANVTQVLLRYNDGSGERTLAMLDDGAHGDDAAGDQVYGASLGARAQWTVVKYWFTASDGTGHTQRYPRDTDEMRNTGYMVHPASVSTQLPVHYVFLSQTDLDRLNGDPWSDSTVPCTVVYDGEVWDDVQTRYRGQSSRGWAKHHWKFKFIKDHRFAGYPMELLDVLGRVGNNHGELGRRLRSININSSWGDKTFMREYLAYEQFRLAGRTVVPGTGGAPDDVYPGYGNYVTWVTMYVNRSYYGMYTYVEQVNEDFLDRNGLDTNGALFKGYGGGFGTGEFVPHTGPVPEAISELSSYLSSMNGLTGAAMTSYIAAHMDETRFIEYLVGNCVVHNADHAGKNYYVYQDYYGPGTRWFMLPWDMDLSMGRNFECGPVCSGVLNDCMRWDWWTDPLIFATQQHKKCDGPWNTIINGFLERTEDYLPAYYAAVGAQIDAHFQQASLLEEIEHLRTLLRDEAAADRVRWPDGTDPAYGNRAFDYHVDELERYVQNRIPTMETALAAAAAPPIENLQCTYNSGASTATLSWTIPGSTYDAIRVYRDGVLLATISGSAVTTVQPAPAGKDFYVFRVASVYQAVEQAGRSCLVTLATGDWIAVASEDFSPAPTAAWQLNGSAAFVTGELQTTPATGSQVGTAFFKTPAPSANFRASFDFRVIGDPSGADGLTFMWIRNPTPEGAIGGAGHFMGFWGGNITGYCVEFDTWLTAEANDPSDNHVGLLDSRTGDLQHVAAAPVVTSFEGTGVFHAVVTCQDGFVEVMLRNVSQGYGPERVIAQQINDYIAGDCYFGFSGSTGGAAGDHRFDNFVLEIAGTPPVLPVPQFTAAPRTGSTPLSVSFTNQTTGDVTTFRWDFGDGQASGEENPLHVYTSAGSYTVALTASGPAGSATERKTAYIVVQTPQGPIADLYAMPTSGSAPLAVQFFAAVSGGEATSFAWSFGDGETGTEQNPAHTYRRTGVFTVALTVQGPNGSDTATKPELIEVSAPPLPVVDFDATPLAGAAPLAVTFRNLTSGLVDTYLWDFGDGEFSTDTNPVHEYAAPGRYSVRLTAAYGALAAEKLRADYIDARSAQTLFVRGDANRDGAHDISDAIAILSYLFAQKPARCLDACDTNDSGAIDIADAIALLSYLFANGAAPAPPFTTPGADPTTDTLDCAT